MSLAVEIIIRRQDGEAVTDLVHVRGNALSGFLWQAPIGTEVSDGAHILEGFSFAPFVIAREADPGAPQED